MENNSGYDTADTDGELCVEQGAPAYKRDPAQREPVSHDRATHNPAQRKYDTDRYYTVEEFDELDRENGFRAELHDGRLVVMQMPAVKHQRIQTAIGGQLWLFLRGKSCKAFNPSPDVQLNENEDTILDPDIIVVCDKTKYAGGKKCVGVPDLVIEILSPSTMRIDRVYKFNKYLEAGVREYWIVDPDTDTVQVNVLQDGAYVEATYGKGDTVAVTALPGCEVSLAEVFEE